MSDAASNKPRAERERFFYKLPVSCPACGHRWTYQVPPLARQVQYQAMWEREMGQFLDSLSDADLARVTYGTKRENLRGVIDRAFEIALTEIRTEEIARQRAVEQQAADEAQAREEVKNRERRK